MPCPLSRNQLVFPFIPCRVEKQSKTVKFTYRVDLFTAFVEELVTYNTCTYNCTDGAGNVSLHSPTEYVETELEGTSKKTVFLNFFAVDTDNN